MNTTDNVKDFKNLDDPFDISNLIENHELISNKKIAGIFKIENPKIIWIDEFICLRRELYAVKCGIDGRNKLKGICKSESKISNLRKVKSV